MRVFKFAVLALFSSTLLGCVTASHPPTIKEPVTNAPKIGELAAADSLSLNETRTTMNVEGGFIREVGQEFSGELGFRMRLIEEHRTTSWSPVVGVCLKEAGSPAKACMHYLRISDMGPHFRAVFYYVANKQAPQQNSEILVDHSAVLGQTINVSVQQKADKLIFVIDGKEETFPVALKASLIEYHCSSGVCEFRD